MCRRKRPVAAGLAKCDMLQDFKLHLMRWHLLPGLGKLLFQLARLLPAPDYQEHYIRDLGPAALQATTPCKGVLI